MKKNYWNSYYKKKFIFKKSNFANFINRKYLKKNMSLLEIGCGSGRDSFFFSKNISKVIAIDSSKEAIKNNIKIMKKNDTKNIEFKNLDINSNKMKKLQKVDFIYARFFIHAINYNLEKKFLEILKKLSHSRTKTAIEFRTTKDPLFNKGKKLSKYERYTDHYRRFIDVQIFTLRLKKNFFKILYKQQKVGFSKYKNDNPNLCRLVIKYEKKQ